MMGRSARNARDDRYPTVANFPDSAGTSISCASPSTARRMASATSSAVLMGCEKTRSGTVATSPKKPVSTGPGFTLREWMPRSCSSMSSAREKARRPAFEAQYVAFVGDGELAGEAGHVHHHAAA